MMADSTSQYQRATPADVLRMEEVADCWWTGDPFYGDRTDADALRRILNSLRATPAVPDREALARALYIVSGAEHSEEERNDMWPKSDAHDIRHMYIRKADRLVRVLGGFPVVRERSGFPLPDFADSEANPLDRWCTYERLSALEAVEQAARALLPPVDHDDYATGYSAQPHHLSPEMEALAFAIHNHDVIAERDAESDPPAVLEKEPRAWEVQRDGKPYNLVRLSENADSYRELPAEYGFTVTPLYAAAPQVDAQTT